MEEKSFQHYVLGFMFSPDYKQVALIRKKKPAWQAGRLNGIGGKVEDGEQGRDAMVREFQEETGLFTDKLSWVYYARMQPGGIDGVIDNTKGSWCVSCYAMSGQIDLLRTTTDEEVVIADVVALPTEYHIIENLPWLIHAALDVLHDRRPLFLDVRYPS